MLSTWRQNFCWLTQSLLLFSHSSPSPHVFCSVFMPVMGLFCAACLLPLPVYFGTSPSTCIPTYLLPLCLCVLSCSLPCICGWRSFIEDVPTALPSCLSSYRPARRGIPVARLVTGVIRAPAGYLRLVCARAFGFSWATLHRQESGSPSSAFVSCTACCSHHHLPLYGVATTSAFAFALCLLLSSFCLPLLPFLPCTLLSLCCHPTSLT